MIPEADDGVPLAHYREHQADVILECRGCKRVRLVPLEALIARLDRQGLPGAEVGVRAAARYVKRPCPRCGGTDFESRPHFHSRDRPAAISGG